MIHNVVRSTSYLEKVGSPPRLSKKVGGGGRGGGGKNSLQLQMKYF